MRYIFYYYNELGTLTLDFWGDNDRKTYSYIFLHSQTSRKKIQTRQRLILQTHKNNKFIRRYK